MSSLTIEQKRNGAVLHLTLTGQIDEDANYAAINAAGMNHIIFDFQGVKLINSTGIQLWIKFLTSLPVGADIIFSRCAIRVVTQINLFPGFLGGRPVQVESFYAPYFCEACDSSCDILLDTNQHPVTSPMKAPKMQCPRCMRPAEFDGIEKKYFLFLAA